MWDKAPRSFPGEKVGKRDVNIPLLAQGDGGVAIPGGAALRGGGSVGTEGWAEVRPGDLRDLFKP